MSSLLINIQKFQLHKKRCSPFIKQVIYETKNEYQKVLILFGAGNRT